MFCFSLQESFAFKAGFFILVMLLGFCAVSTKEFDALALLFICLGVY
jgi:hypothetical protein